MNGWLGRAETIGLRDCRELPATHPQTPHNTGTSDEEIQKMVTKEGFEKYKEIATKNIVKTLGVCPDMHTCESGCVRAHMCTHTRSLNGFGASRVAPPLHGVGPPGRSSRGGTGGRHALP